MDNIQLADPTAQLPYPYPGLYPDAVVESIVRGPTTLPQETYEASVELAIGQKRGRLARGIPAANRSLIVTKTIAASLDALGERGWAHRIRQCGQDFWTLGCPNGHGGTVVAAMAKRCGLSCCPVCTRLTSRRLASEVFRTMKNIVPEKGHQWRFLTVSLRPRATFNDAWSDIKAVRTKLMSWLSKLGGKDAICAIEFGQQGHPHLHVLFCGPWVVRDTLSRMLVGWTGGRVIDLEPDEWAASGRPTKRGKQRYRTWRADGGDWYVDVRNVEGGLAGGVREVTKYLADPFGGGTAGTPQGHAMIVGAARNAAAIAVAGKGSHRVQGYVVLRGVVGRALGKKNVKSMESTIAETVGVKSPRHCGCCGAELVIVRKVDAASLAFFNRAAPRALEPPPTVH